MIQDILNLSAAGEEATTEFSAISLWQPWATWIVLGWKTVETRLHDRFAKLEGRRVAIHAARVWDKKAISIAKPYLTREQMQETYKLLASKHTPYGAVVCTAFVRECKLTEPDDAQSALIECDTPRYGLWLDEIKALVPPLHVPGRQGIFTAEIPK